MIIQSILSSLIFSFLLSGFNFGGPVITSPAILEKPATYHLPVKKETALPLTLNSKNVAVWDAKNKFFIFEKSADTAVPLASISKLMTALVFLENNQGFDKIITLQDSDRREGGKIYLYRGDQTSVKNLFLAMLIGSDNTATIALVRSTGLSEANFIKAMNAKAIKLGLFNMSFADPVGLNDNNVGTAKEVALLLNEALKNKLIADAVNQSEFSFKTEAGVAKKIPSTDWLLDNFSSSNAVLIGGKTGHTNAAGYCLAAKFADTRGHDIISVVMGAPSETSRFTESAKVANWVYDNYSW